ncbi:MAG: hypothetical protein U5K76_10025 [Woeseiaceae bacterium]|nr:hypothetical protein [Woeseiaceae bacterium]
MKIQKHFVVRIGGNVYSDTPNLLACKGEPLLKVTRNDRNGELDVELGIYDERGRERAVVRQDDVSGGNEDQFDVRMTDNRYTVTDRKNERVICDIRRRAHARDMDLDVSLLMHTPEGFLVHANPDQTNIRIRTSEGVVRGRDAAININ